MLYVAFIELINLVLVLFKKTIEHVLYVAYPHIEICRYRLLGHLMIVC